MVNGRLIKFVMVAMVGTLVLAWNAPAEAKAPVHCDDCGHSVCDCCPPKILYHHHAKHRKICCGCCESKKVVLSVTDPVCCKTHEIPVCVPACCEGEPKVCSHCGVLGRGIVEYEWCCGYRVKVVFRNSGDIVVHTYGR